MRVYHGSPRRFSTLRISKSLSIRDTSELSEGLGVYFSLYPDVAASYGRYLYTLEINDKYIIDFRDMAVCRRYLDRMIFNASQESGVNLLNYLGNSTDIILNGMITGQLSLYSLWTEVELWLDSVDNWYLDTSQTKRDKIHSELVKYLKYALKAYLFNYHIKGVGVIKTVEPTIVQIIKCDKT